MTIAVQEIPGGVATTLTPFPGLPHPSLEIVVEASRLWKDGLRLWFTLKGDVDAVVLPELAPGVRADGLWEHTCFEAFVRGVGQDYQEFNLSPSGDWAAYRLQDYRDGMTRAQMEPLHVNVMHLGGMVSIGADLHSPDLPGGAWHVGLSAVIEARDGSKSYWALRHPPEGPPDFHHPDCFALTLPAPGGA